MNATARSSSDTLLRNLGNRSSPMSANGNRPGPRHKHRHGLSWTVVVAGGGASIGSCGDNGGGGNGGVLVL